MTKPNERTNDEWRESLSPEEFHVCREHGTERAFTGAYVDTKTDGVTAASAVGRRCFHRHISSILVPAGRASGNQQWATMW